MDAYAALTFFVWWAVLATGLAIGLLFVSCDCCSASEERRARRRMAERDLLRYERDIMRLNRQIAELRAGARVAGDATNPQRYMDAVREAICQ